MHQYGIAIVTAVEIHHIFGAGRHLQPPWCAFAFPLPEPGDGRWMEDRRQTVPHPVFGDRRDMEAALGLRRRNGLLEKQPVYAVPQTVNPGPV